MQKLREILESYQGKREDIIPILQDIQGKYGYLPENALRELSKFTGVSESQIYGIATFYAQFRFTPKGKKHVMVCTGTACHVKGSDQIIDAIQRHLKIKEGDTTPDNEYSLEAVGCIGCCSLAPCAMINEKVISRIKPRQIKRLLPQKS
ncbi:NADH-quinone oxidoreductase subunit NuoE [Methanothermobacter tenebrarum]|uniref:NADH-quinone oxidoreductase subunit NuoE n=1 Tax=Methanothermobacter tenebrarum TaxID=680118 RepID=A0A328PBP0_9EURY|nr:NADH-quinone oxidoreductase subunit NuoE [Methanothermobacter tenebrarum]MBC7117344.1 NADH-quinone oxidoreductase subunit NuoE [Methanobacteriaceae archaeon]NPV65449.1 NADH-quinone oxidoreductase subunit NuoE [Methanobacteriaceae archaeon]RAO78521.1 NADH-quinone oxidoreductase subunit NuoE [Methanothermobacter tenebrarum]